MIMNGYKYLDDAAWLSNPASDSLDTIDVVSLPRSGQHGDDIRALHKIGRLLGDCSAAVVLIKAENLVLSKTGKSLNRRSAANKPFELQSRNANECAQLLDAVHPRDDSAVNLKKSMFCWCLALRSHLDGLVAAAIERLGTLAHQKKTYRHTISTDQWFQHVSPLSPLTLACLSILAIALVFFGLSQRNVDHLGMLLEGVVNMAFKQAQQEQGRSPSRFQLPLHGSKASVNQLNLKVDFVSYVCCPNPACCKLFDIAATEVMQDACDNEVDGIVCGQPLTRECSSSDGTKFRRPIKLYHTRSILEEIGRLLARPGIELAIESYVDTMRDLPEDGCTYDIWHGQAFRNFPWWKCGDPSTGEIRLMFSLSVDWFNAHHSTRRGKSWSVGAIYLTILNLPPHLRHLPENMILVGLIPGPTKPHGNALDRFIDKLVDWLLALWGDGVYLSRTCRYTFGRLCKAALGPVSCDLDAVRALVGMGSHTFKHPCSFCWIAMEEVQAKACTFGTLRTQADHRQKAALHQSASVAEKKMLWSDHGIRNCPLLRLPYWDPMTWIVVDPMHNWLLGVLQAHLGEVFGLKGKKSKGCQGSNQQRHAGDGGAAFGYHILCREGFQEEDDSKALRKDLAGLYRPTLVALIDRFGLRPEGGSKADLARCLVQYRRQVSNLPAPSNDERRMILDWLIVRSSSAKQWRNFHRQDLLFLLKAYCSEEEFQQIFSQDKKALANVLRAKISHLVDPDIATPSPSRKPIIGQQELQAILDDRKAVVFPSWLPKGPANFGAAAHGSLSAAEVRTSGLYHVSFTLTRLWGLDDSKRPLLHNYINLVEAVDLALRRKMSHGRLLAVGKHVASYMTSSRKLFDWIPGTTNEHLMLHQPDLLHRFGPSRYWWCFPAERWNGILQSTSSNHLLGGQLELSMATKFLQRVILRSAAMSNILPEQLEGVHSAICNSVGDGYSGLLLQENQHSYGSLWAIHPLDGGIVRDQFRNVLQGHCARGRSWTVIASLEREGAILTAHGDEWDAARATRARNSTVLVFTDKVGHPAIVRGIFGSDPPGAMSIDRVKLVVQRFEMLDQVDHQHDPFGASYGIRHSNGDSHERFYLQYASLERQLLVVSPKDIVSHAAYTPFEGLSKPAAAFTILNKY